jgi:hypothetical protein
MAEKAIARTGADVSSSECASTGTSLRQAESIKNQGLSSRRPPPVRLVNGQAAANVPRRLARADLSLARPPGSGCRHDPGT